VALQEVTARTWPLWEQSLAGLGLPHVRCSLAEADPARIPAGPRRHGVLLAARSPLEPAAALPVPWPESALAARIGEVTIHTVHVPNAANGEIKVDTLRAIRAGLAGGGGGARILCGDLNTPRREQPDGTVVSFARDSHGRLRPERGEPWDEGELGVVPGLRDLGFTDAFRALHGYAEREPSWVYRRWGGGYRLDHVFLSAGLLPMEALYRHDWRDSGLSDHSAFQVVVSLTDSIA
jgi:exonuclease III